MRIETCIGDDLLERPADGDELERAIEQKRDDLRALRRQLRDSPNELDRTRLGRVLDRLGYYYTLRGNYQRAANCLDEAVDIWDDFGSRRAAFLSRIRRTEVRLARDRLADALRRTDDLVDAATDAPFRIYRDFALELRGRIRAKQGNLEAAREDLTDALEVRRDAGRERLADRTDRILELLAESS